MTVDDEPEWSVSDVPDPCKLARDPNTPAEALTELASNNIYSVRCAVAGNPSTPTKTLTKLASDNKYVRRDVARNPNTPTKTLTKLASDDDYSVRIAVARHPQTSEPVLLYLLLRSYPEEEVLRSVLRERRS